MRDDIFCLMQALEAVGRVGLRRPSLEGFSGLLSPERVHAGFHAHESGYLRNVVHVQIVRALAVQRERESRHQDAIELLTSALPMLEDGGLSVLKAAVLIQRGNLVRRTGSHEHAKVDYRTAKTLLDVAGCGLFDAWVLYELGYIEGKEGRYSQAVQLMQESLDVGREEGDLVAVLAACGAVARQHLLDGRLDAMEGAMSVFDHALMSSAGEKDADWIARWRLNMASTRVEWAVLYSSVEEARQALGEFRKALEQWPEIHSSFRSGLERWECEIAMRSGDSRGQGEIARRLLTDALATGSTSEGLSDHYSLAGRTLVSDGDEAEGVAFLEQALDLNPDDGNRRGMLTAAIALARILIARSRLEEAKDLVRKALTWCTEHHAPQREELQGLLTTP